MPEATPTSRPDDGSPKPEETTIVPGYSQEHRNLTGLGVAYSSGSKDGYDEGYREGYRKGHDEGFKAGYESRKREEAPAI